MLKIITLIGLCSITIGGFAQKPSFYIQNQEMVNNHQYFYIYNGNLDIHELTSPFIDKNRISNPPFDRDFILYYELSLKNLTIIDTDKAEKCIVVNLYEASEFNQNMIYPAGYKPKKLRSKHVILDLVSVGSGNLIYRAWIDTKRIKLPDGYQKDQHTISLLLKGFTIVPTVSD